MSTPIDRRHFLRLSGAGAVAAAGLTMAACARGGSGIDERALARPELLTALGPDVVRDLGRRYRQNNPGENDAERVRDAILAAQSWPARIGLTRESIGDQIRAEFANGHTVIVDGWVLAATEARQCALYSMVGA
jgi:hypothetical protein